MLYCHVHDSLNHYSVDVFGGPDKAHASFFSIQKAINYAMTLFLTTGGIRGWKKKLYIAYRHYSRFQSVYWLSVHSFAACFWCLLLFMPFSCL
ncbi:hypothetical protein [uncultured Parabacteroides sp.]|uniref:hypothetical protein n=1 Tax=uncultured Parabacteroides sp. TaxID=512312 RepID=UPI00262C555B|nr:hypothetical protein [uncultured Parabacteroides sp.]